LRFFCARGGNAWTRGWVGLCCGAAWSVRDDPSVFCCLGRCQVGRDKVSMCKKKIRMKVVRVRGGALDGEAAPLSFSCAGLLRHAK